MPFLFKHIVDSLSTAGDAGAAAVAAAQAATAAAAASVSVDPLVLTAAVAVPTSLLLGYGLARATAEGANQLRNAVFAAVAQRAIRLVSRDVFR